MTTNSRPQRTQSSRVSESREPDVYGSTTWDQLVDSLEAAATVGETISVRQTNDESELIAWIHEALDCTGGSDSQSRGVYPLFLRVARTRLRC